MIECQVSLALELGNERTIQRSEPRSIQWEVWGMALGESPLSLYIYGPIVVALSERRMRAFFPFLDLNSAFKIGWRGVSARDIAEF